MKIFFLVKNNIKKLNILTYKELAKICVIFCENEDNIYPPPQFKGGEMLREFLNECMINRTVDKDILKKYKLNEEKKDI